MPGNESLRKRTRLVVGLHERGPTQRVRHLVQRRRAKVVQPTDAGRNPRRIGAQIKRLRQVETQKAVWTWNRRTEEYLRLRVAEDHATGGGRDRREKLPALRECVGAEINRQRNRDRARIQNLRFDVGLDVPSAAMRFNPSSDKGSK